MVPKIVFVAAALFFAFFIGMNYGIWQYNKYEILHVQAMFVAPDLVGYRAEQAANRWDAFCKVHPQQMRKLAANYKRREGERFAKGLAESKELK